MVYSDVLRELKKDKEFSTPIIALTVAHNARILFLEKYKIWNYS